MIRQWLVGNILDGQVRVGYPVFPKPINTGSRDGEPTSAQPTPTQEEKPKSVKEKPEEPKKADEVPDTFVIGTMLGGLLVIGPDKYMKGVKDRVLGGVGIAPLGAFVYRKRKRDEDGDEFLNHRGIWGFPYYFNKPSEVLEALRLEATMGRNDK